jgi:CYTH domain-containing protein
MNAAYARPDPPLDQRTSADSFQSPAWFGREVTGDQAYLNESLATKGMPESRD